MASSTWLFSMGLVFILVGVFGPNAKAQSGCTNVLIGMASCINYVTGSSSNPSSACCSQLASVVQSEPQCLCTALNGDGITLGININQTLALALPGACNVRTPPVSRCDAANEPASSPMGSQEGAPADSPNANSDYKPNHAMSGSETVISNGYGSTARISPPLVVIIMMMSSYPSI